MKLSLTRTATAAVFDDPNSVASAGQVPVLRPAESVALTRVAGEQVDKRPKVASLVRNPQPRTYVEDQLAGRSPGARACDRGPNAP